MKIAVSSASFSSAFSGGHTTLLEWLDACANELEVDGIVIDKRDLTRTDDDYLAQLKKNATDLGLTIAALATSGDLPDAADYAIAGALGAPIVIASAHPASDDANAWNVFVEAAKTSARAAKKANVVLAIASVEKTLCADAAALKHIAYDVDGSWLRYALDPLAAKDPSDLDALLPKAVVARAWIGDVTRFAIDGDERCAALITALARFRGFIVLESDAIASPTSAYHAAIARFVDQRADALRSAIPHG